VIKRSMKFMKNKGSTVADTAFNAAVTIDNSIPAGRVRVTGVASTTIKRGISVQIQEVVQ
jgi:hypothetical protein